MSTVAFKGFATGSTVTIGGITVNAWGQVEGGGTIWDRTPDANASVTINVTRSNHRVAPEGAFFNLTLGGFDTNTLPAGRYDPSYHDKYVFWDYDDAYTFVAPTQVRAMDAADGSSRTNARYSRGPLGSHVFRATGNYVVRVAVMEPSSGKIAFGSVNVSVGNPDTFYAGAATIFVDRTGGHTNAPSGARTYNNIDAALGQLRTARTPHRVVLERGQIHTMTSNFNYRPQAGAAGLSLRIEARDGNGAKPIIRAGSGINADSDLITDNSLRNVSGTVDTGTVIKGIDFQGPWNVRTASGTRVDCVYFNGAYSSKHALVDDCDFSNWGETFYASAFGGRTPDRSIFFNDVAITSWAGIGFFGGGDSVLSFTGCGFAQDPDAITRQAPDNKTLGPIRVSSARMCNIWACDLFSATGWSSYNSISAVQPGLRWNTSPNVTGAMANIQACTIESGRLAMSLKPQNTSTVRRVANAVVEGNIAISGFQGDAVVHSAFGGMTYRNNIFVFAGNKNSGPIGGQGQIIRGFIWFYGGAQGSSTNEATPVTLHNNTFVNLTSTNAAVTADQIGMSNVILRNNLTHLPGRGLPYEGLSATQAFVPRYKGYRPNVSTVRTAHANPSDSGSIWAPQIGSPALGAALSEPSSKIDFQGTCDQNRPPSEPRKQTDHNITNIPRVPCVHLCAPRGLYISNACVTSFRYLNILNCDQP